MVGSFHLRVLTPDATLVDAPAASVVVPGMEGEFTVLPLHMPIISALRPGRIQVTLADGSTDTFMVNGGFADVGPKHCVILAEGLIAA